MVSIVALIPAFICFTAVYGVKIKINIHPRSGCPTGDNARLACLGGSPTSQVNWNFNNSLLVVCTGLVPSPLNSDFRCVHTKTSDVMYIINVTKEREGFYSCEKPGVGQSDEQFLKVHSQLVSTTTSYLSPSQLSDPNTSGATSPPTTSSGNAGTTDSRHTAIAGNSKASPSVQSTSKTVTSNSTHTPTVSNKMGTWNGQVNTESSAWVHTHSPKLTTMMGSTPLRMNPSQENAEGDEDFTVTLAYIVIALLGLLCITGVSITIIIYRKRRGQSSANYNVNIRDSVNVAVGGDQIVNNNGGPIGHMQG